MYRYSQPAQCQRRVQYCDRHTSSIDPGQSLLDSQCECEEKSGSGSTLYLWLSVSDSIVSATKILWAIFEKHPPYLTRSNRSQGPCFQHNRPSSPHQDEQKSRRGLQSIGDSPLGRSGNHNRSDLRLHTSTRCPDPPSPQPQTEKIHSRLLQPEQTRQRYPPKPPQDPRGTRHPLD